MNDAWWLIFVFLGLMWWNIERRLDGILKMLSHLQRQSDPDPDPDDD